MCRLADPLPIGDASAPKFRHGDFDKENVALLTWSHLWIGGSPIAAQRGHHRDAADRHWFLAPSSTRPRYVIRATHSLLRQVMASRLQVRGMNPPDGSRNHIGSCCPICSFGADSWALTSRYDLTRSSMDISSASSAGIRSEPAGSLSLRRLAEASCLRGTHSRLLEPRSWRSPMRSFAWKGSRAGS
jgi:hypothetical protein